MSYLLVFVAGGLLAIAVNRIRWAIFPMSGGPSAFVSLVDGRTLLEPGEFTCCKCQQAVLCQSCARCTYCGERPMISTSAK